MEDTTIVAVHDASFSNEAGLKSQQGYMLFATQRSSLASGGAMHFLDWSSSTIKRVVRSTLAAESAAASKCFDRATYLRVIISECMKGPKAAQSWRWQDLAKEVPMIFVSDCRSMVENIRKTGASLIAEQRVAEGLEVSRREAAARAVPAEMDSEDEASYSMHMPPTCYARTVGSTRGSPGGVVALSKHTGVGQAAKKTAQTTPHTPKGLQRSRPRFSKAGAGQGLRIGQRQIGRSRRTLALRVHE